MAGSLLQILDWKGMPFGSSVAGLLITQGFHSMGGKFRLPARGLDEIEGGGVAVVAVGFPGGGKAEPIWKLGELAVRVVERQVVF